MCPSKAYGWGVPGRLCPVTANSGERGVHTWPQALTGVELPSDPMYDIQIKRIHEYKRQYLNILSLIHRYAAIKAASPEERAAMVPRVCLFGGKAASAYYMAKKIVRLINAVGTVVNSDPDVGDLLKASCCPYADSCVRLRPWVHDKMSLCV